MKSRKRIVKSGATDSQRPLCAGGCGATGPAWAEGARSPLVRAEGATGAKPPAVSMLDNNIHNRTNDNISPNLETPAQRKSIRKKGRFFHCLKSGMKWHADDEQYFLTLTSSPQSPSDLYKSFHRLNVEMSRVTPSIIVKKGYLKPYEAKKWYKKERWEEPLKFEYIKQHTSEGFGVLHIVFAGDHWPITFFRDRWVKIHKAPQMVIKHIPKNDEDEQKKVISYQMKQYLYNHDAYIRFSCSRHWLFPGYRKIWLGMVNYLGFQEAIKKWNDMLLLKKMPGQRNFHNEVVETMTEKKKARITRIERKRKKAVTVIKRGDKI